jgi:hypothetical protein
VRYLWRVHAHRFSGSEAEGRAKYSNMKRDLEEIMTEPDNETRYAKMKRFADVY